MEKGVKALHMAGQKKSNSQRDSGVGIDDEEVADDKEAILPEERVPLERPGMPSIAEILQRTSN